MLAQEKIFKKTQKAKQTWTKSRMLPKDSMELVNNPVGSRQSGLVCGERHGYGFNWKLFDYFQVCCKQD